jgi:hypothetical protein
MFHLDGEIGFEAGERRQQMIQDLLRRQAERAALGADLAPAVRVAEIALREIPRAEPDEITVIGELHKKGAGRNEGGDLRAIFMLRGITRNQIKKAPQMNKLKAVGSGIGEDEN